MNYLGDFALDATVYFKWTTNNKDGAAVNPSSAFDVTDIQVYKNGTQAKSSTSGLTVTSPFAGQAGMHAVSIDTSNDTGDAGFWTAGADYDVLLLTAKTVDGEAVTAALFSFSTENRSTTSEIAKVLNVLGTPVVDVSTDIAGLQTTADSIEADTQDIQATKMPTTHINATNGDVDNVTLVATTTTNTDMRGTDGASSQASVDAVQTTVDTIDGNVDVAVSTRMPTAHINATAGAVNTVLTTNTATTVTTLDTDAIAAASIENGALVAAKFGTDFLTANGLAADAVAEIQAGLATSADISGLNDISPAQVNAEMVDVMTVDTIPELVGPPPATPTMFQLAGWQTFLARNDIRDDRNTGQFTVRNDAGTVVGTATVSDAGNIYTRGKFT